MTSFTVWYFALATLVVTRGTALVSGWDVSTVETGSMRPALNVGDLVAYEPVELVSLKRGQIVVFDSPVAPGNLMVHRFVGFNPDGSFTTKGDSNENTDSTPVPGDSLRGVVRMVSPFAGYPSMLLSTGRYLALSLLIVVLLLAAIIVHAPEPHFLRRTPNQRPVERADPKPRLARKAKGKTFQRKPQPGLAQAHHSRA